MAARVRQRQKIFTGTKYTEFMHMQFKFILPGLHNSKNIIITVDINVYIWLIMCRIGVKHSKSAGHEMIL